MVLAGLATGTMISSSTFSTLLGLEQKILKVPGCGDFADGDVGRTGAVGAAVGTTGQHAFHDLLRTRELQGTSTSGRLP
jgi:hypothetical protein